MQWWVFVQTREVVFFIPSFPCAIFITSDLFFCVSSHTKLIHIHLFAPYASVSLCSLLSLSFFSLFFLTCVLLPGDVFSQVTHRTRSHRCKTWGEWALTIVEGPTHIGQEALLQIWHTHHTVNRWVRNVFLEAIMVSNSHYVALVWSMRISNFKCVRVSGWAKGQQYYKHYWRACECVCFVLDFKYLHDKGEHAPAKLLQLERLQMCASIWLSLRAEVL